MNEQYPNNRQNRQLIGKNKMKRLEAKNIQNT